MDEPDTLERSLLDTGEPTPPHHHYIGSIEDGHIAGPSRQPGAGASCRSAAASCHAGLDVGLLVVCPHCESGALDCIFDGEHEGEVEEVEVIVEATKVRTTIPACERHRTAP